MTPRWLFLSLALPTFFLPSWITILPVGFLVPLTFTLTVTVIFVPLRALSGAVSFVFDCLPLVATAVESRAIGVKAPAAGLTRTVSEPFWATTYVGPVETTLPSTYHV